MTVAQLTRKVCGPDFLAKSDGRCRLCPEPITARVDFITEVEGVKGYFHSHCGKAYCRTLDEHLPDEGDQDGER